MQQVSATALVILWENSVGHSCHAAAIVPYWLLWQFHAERQVKLDSLGPCQICDVLLVMWSTTQALHPSNQVHLAMLGCSDYSVWGGGSFARGNSEQGALIQHHHVFGAAAACIISAAIVSIINTGAFVNCMLGFTPCSFLVYIDVVYNHGLVDRSLGHHFLSLGKLGIRIIVS